ncbi:MAG: AAA family ATPase [Ilumatobacteraceae bacterium]
MAGIVGRELEQRQLLQLLATARSDGAVAIALEGEAGIGKSTLLEWMCRQADGYTVLRVRGHEADQGSGYLVLRQLLKPILPQLESLDAHLADALQSALRMSDAPVNEALVPLAVLELVSIASTATPVLLALDDAHLFDAASLAALTFVARRMISERVVVAFALHPHELPDPAALAGVPRLRLRELDDDASRALVEANGQRYNVAVQQWCRGNPLALQHSAAVVNGPALGQLPERLREGCVHELGRLPEPTRQALSVVAVAGSVPDSIRDEAMVAIGLSPSDLSAAVAANVLLPEGGFRNPLLRAAAAPSTQRAAEIHDALAGAFAGAETPAQDVVLLHRLQGAGPIALDTVVAAEELADTLQSFGRTDDAHALFVAAAGRAPDQASRSRLLRRAGLALALAERYAASVPFFRRALDEASTPAARVQVMRSMVWSELWSGATISDVGARLLAELRAVPADEADPEQLAMGWGSLIALFIAFDIHSALAALAEMPTGLDVEADALMARCLAADGAVAPVRQRFQDRVKGVEILQHGVIDPAGSVYGELLLLEGRWAEADRWAKRYFDDVRAAHNDSEFGPAAARWVVSRLFLGDCLTAFGLALTTVERVPDDGSALGIGALAGAVVGAEVATEWATRCLEKGRRHGITAFVADGFHRLGLIALAAGRPGEAADLLANAWRAIVDHGFRHPGYTFARGDIAEAFALAGRTADARAVIAELEAGPFHLPWALGVAARARGMLGESDQFVRAGELLAESPWEVARTQLAWARSSPDGSAERLQHAGEAVIAFDAMGARPWAALARALMTAGEAPVVAQPDPLADLSDRERTVAYAVARGLANKEVAGELFISLKTVDAHLQQIYRKLDIRSRTQLAALCHSSAQVV